MKSKKKIGNYKYRRKRLKYNLFRIPTYIVLLTLLIIVVSFYFFSREYIDNNTQSSMDKKISIFDNYYEKKSASIDWDNKDDIYQMVPINSILVDENKKILHPAKDDINDVEFNKVKSIVNRYDINEIDFYKDRPTVMNINDSTYYVSSKKYEGFYDGSFVRSLRYSKERNPFNKVYTVILYTNITPTQNFIELMIKMLVLLMVNLGIFSALFIFLVAKEIDKSFVNLKNYIVGVSKEQSIDKSTYFNYREFDDIADTVDEIAEARIKSEESKKIFFQNASHELRTPLMSIQGYAEGIEAGIIKDSKNAAKIICEESQKMTSLVDEILLLSKIESSDLMSEKEILDFRDILHSCIWNVKKIAQTRGIQIEEVIDENRLDILGNEEMLERVINNILSNALRYAKTKIVISAKAIDDEFILVSIFNDGENIEEKDIDFIFDRFYKGKGGQSGIGLSVAKDIVNKHNGEIGVCSNENGVSFIMKFNLHK